MRPPRALGLRVAVLAFAGTSLAFGQMGMMGGGMMPGGGMGPPPSSKKPKKEDKKKSEDEPELHAAPGASDEELGSGSEPSLPSDPLEIPAHIKGRIGTDTPLDEQEYGRAKDTERRFYGVYYAEKSGKYGFRATMPPLWIQRTQPSRTRPEVTDQGDLYGLLYFRRRSAERADDVLFPLVYNMRDKLTQSRTTVLGPFVDRKTPTEWDRWAAPLYFQGGRPGGGYTIIPPLLYYSKRDQEGGTQFLGPAFCFWKRGSRCDTRTATDIDFGIAPLYFYGQNRTNAYELIPPLLHYYAYNDRDLSWLNVWGPYYRSHTQKRDLLHLMPLYWSVTKPGGARHTTVLPFFHYGHEGNSSLLVNPLFLWRRGDEGERTFVTWGYARHRGRTELDMITPLFWQHRDPDAHSTETLLFPFYYRKTSPRESTIALFPFYAKKERFAVSKTTFITPFFQHSHDLTGWSTNIHPILYLGRSNKQSHTVIAPLFFDFAGTESRATVAFPVYWRFSNLNSTTQLVGNVYYSERKVQGGLNWQFHVFPLFSYGETPRGHFWNVLYGLAGFTRDGGNATARTFWIPIPLSREATALPSSELPTPF
ncbi:MAG TPA: hypothetical protein VKP30_29200 [Polyangiaceae bacterium]|nr:hypothetical protein [Polyangiaceae bacterium]